MQDGCVKKIIWIAYAIPAIPLLIYTSVNLTTGSRRVVICSLMFVVFTGLVWFINYVAGQLRQGLAGRLFINPQSNFTGEAGDTVEISDPAADDFLRAMGATAAGQSRD
jgi:hypothetical protein